MRILLTGGAGFIGFHAARALLARGHEIVALDNLNPYYDPALKRARLALLEAQAGFRFASCDISDAAALAQATGRDSYDVILHLAAQAGVRSFGDVFPVYVRRNLVATQRVFEAAAAAGVGATAT